MNLSNRGLRHRPLVPDLVVGCAPPHIHVQGLACWAVDGLLEREVDGEPTEHVGCVRGWVRTQMHLEGQSNVSRFLHFISSRPEQIGTVACRSSCSDAMTALCTRDCNTRRERLLAGDLAGYH